MSNIAEPGYYDVTLEGCGIEEIKEGIQYVLPGRTDDGQHITAFLSATPTFIQRGDNAGRSLFEVTVETLQKVGMSSDPTDVESLNGKRAGFKVDWDEYRGERRLKVKFVNPPREQVKRQDRQSVFAKFGLGTAKSAPPADTDTLKF